MSKDMRALNRPNSYESVQRVDRDLRCRPNRGGSSPSPTPSRTLPRTKLLRQLRKHRARSAFRGEEERRERLLTGLRKARLTGIRVTLPAETLDAKLASLPEGVSVSRDRIEVRFNGAKEAVERLYALAYALVNDYERFEELVDGGAVGGRKDVGRGEVSE